MYYRIICIISIIGFVGTQVQLPAMDATCDSIRDKYEHFSWACGPRSCAEGEKSLHNRYLFEKVRCDSDDPSRICCPTFDYQITKSSSKNASASSNSSASSTTTIKTAPPKKEIDESCSKIKEKYKNRVNWSCQKECTGEKKSSGEMSERVSCDQNDESMICCPQESKQPGKTTSLPPTLTTLASTTAKAPVTTSQTETPRSPSQTSARKAVTKATPSAPTKSATPVDTKSTPAADAKSTTPVDIDVGCKRTRQKYDKSVKWVCEKQPCADSQLNQLNVLVKTKTLCDSKDVTKICCAKLDTRKPSSSGIPDHSEVDSCE